MLHTVSSPAHTAGHVDIAWTDETTLAILWTCTSPYCL